MTLHKLADALGQRLFCAVTRTGSVKFIDHIKPVKGDIHLFLMGQIIALGPLQEQRIKYVITSYSIHYTKLYEESEKLTEKFSIDNYEVETFSIKPRRSDIFDVEIALLWDVAD